MAKSYNYTIAETHQGKVYVPYVGIEVKGYSTLISALIGFLTVTVVVGFPFSLFLGTNGYFIGLIAALAVITFAITYTNEVNNETGRTKLKEFYYLNIRKYRYVYDCNGNKHYLKSKTKGVVYFNARRTNTRI